MANMKDKIIEIAKNLNIDLIGFTSIHDFDELRSILWERKAKGYLSGFEEENIEKRIRPLQVFPEGKTILSIGLSYHYQWDKPVEEALQGRISKSSWGKDYHIVLKEKMEALMKAIQAEIMPMRYVAFVDTGPLVDRAVAHRAGLGSYGKNGFIIHPDFGSYIFLGTILVDQVIEEDQRADSNICGDCNKCIRACPTGALEGPFLFNAQKCISYLTQKKGILSDEERRFIGSNIYGCDVCQVACPYNKEAKHTKNHDFKPDLHLTSPSLGDLLRMSNREFKDSFGNIAAGWRGRKILQRNAIIALGNSRDRNAIPLLRESLKDIRWEIRRYAVWALAQHGEEGRSIIHDWKKMEEHPEVLEEMDKWNN